MTAGICSRFLVASAVITLSILWSIESVHARVGHPRIINTRRHHGRQTQRRRNARTRRSQQEQRRQYSPRLVGTYRDRQTIHAFRSNAMMQEYENTARFDDAANVYDAEDGRAFALLAEAEAESEAEDAAYAAYAAAYFGAMEPPDTIFSFAGAWAPGTDRKVPATDLLLAVIEGGAKTFSQYLAHSNVPAEMAAVAKPRIVFTSPANQIKIQVDDGKAPFDISWHYLETAFNAKRLNADFLFAVGHLRRLTMIYLMHQITDAVLGRMPFGIAARAGKYTEDVCFADFGSRTATSDLDFSRVDYRQPLMVVPILVDYYNKFKVLYGNLPPDTFDMNFYVASGIIKSKLCWDLLDTSDAVAAKAAYYTQLRKLFRAVPQTGFPGVGEAVKKSKYFLGNYADANFEYYDRYLAMLMIVRELDRIELDRVATDIEILEWKIKSLEPPKLDPAISGTPTFELENMRLLQYSVLFYFIVDKWAGNSDVKIVGGTTKLGELDDEGKDRVKLYLNALMLYMTYWSNEAYISKPALAQHGMGDPYTAGFTDLDYYLSFLDNFQFIKDWYGEAVKEWKAKPVKDKTLNELAYAERALYITFYDRISKYLARCMDAAKETPVGTAPPFTGNDFNTAIFVDALYWKDNIRGKIKLKDMVAVVEAANGWRSVDLTALAGTAPFKRAVAILKGWYLHWEPQSPSLRPIVYLVYKYLAETFANPVITAFCSEPHIARIHEKYPIWRRVFLRISRINYETKFFQAPMNVTKLANRPYANAFDSFKYTKYVGQNQITKGSITEKVPKTWTDLKVDFGGTAVELAKRTQQPLTLTVFDMAHKATALVRQ